MKLKVVNSNSSGNSYALDTGEEILLIEAGCKMADVKKAIDYRLADVVGCIVTHEHGDHAKCAVEYARFGVNVYGPEALKNKKDFPYGKFMPLTESITKKIGSFSVTPFVNHHDVPIFGYLIYHKDMGVMLFSTDSYKIDMALTGINHFLIEANYSDAIIKENFKNGKIDKHQVDRIMLSHMSLDYCVKYLRDCQADRTARTITLCDLSDRNSDPKQFRDTVAGAFAIPTFIAQRGLVINLCTSV
jgi:glyoxylase-like metal-dependent hydrolase (beta-lactamase superfamily II)